VDLLSAPVTPAYPASLSMLIPKRKTAWLECHVINPGHGQKTTLFWKGTE
jgi:hypothetical protein